MTIGSRAAAIDGLLADYAVGSLPAPLHTLVASHLAMTQTSHAYVSALEDVCGAEIEAAECGFLRNRDQRLAAIFDAAPSAADDRPARKDDTVPGPLAAYLGAPIEALRWRTKLPGFRESVIDVRDGLEASMLWVKAGRQMPRHTHEGAEITLVLRGAFSDSSGRYGRGDIVIAESDVDHRPQIDPTEDCICFVVTDAPLRLTGPIGRVISRLFRH
jgi:putative transcriptional regulator